MRKSDQISEWMLRKIWIVAMIVTAIIIGLSIWVVILSNQKIDALTKNETYTARIAILEKDYEVLKKNNSDLYKDKAKSDIRFEKLLEKYINTISDEEYTDKNPIDFIPVTGEWYQIIGTIGPVAEGRTDLQDRFLNSKD